MLQAPREVLPPFGSCPGHPLFAEFGGRSCRTPQPTSRPGAPGSAAHRENRQAGVVATARRGQSTTGPRQRCPDRVRLDPIRAESCPCSMRIDTSFEFELTSCAQSSIDSRRWPEAGSSFFRPRSASAKSWRRVASWPITSGASGPLATPRSTATARLYAQVRHRVDRR